MSSLWSIVLVALYVCGVNSALSSGVQINVDNDFTDPILAGYERVGNKYYLIDRSVTANWHDALALCRQKNGFLASLKNREEQMALSDALMAKGVVRGTQLWTSGTDLAKEKNFVWITNGNTVSGDLFCEWEPSEEPKGERCLAASMLHMTYFGLNNISCGDKLMYICQLEPLKVDIVWH